MASGILQVCGFVASLVGWLMAVATCAHPNWRRNDLQGEVIESVIRTTGLWVRCTHQTTGHWTCDDYDSFFMDLPGPLQGARAFTCIAVACGFLGVLFAVFGINCTTVLADEPTIKGRIALFAALLHVVGGLSLGIGVSWFATEVLQNYQDPNQAASGLRYVYGEALFVGWVGMVVMVVGGLLLGCGSRGTNRGSATSYDTRPCTYNYPKPKPASAEYI